MMVRFIRASVLSLCGVAFAGGAAAQGWSFDARKIALGGVGEGNLAADMVGEQRPYRTIVLPFGLTQVLDDKDAFDPGNDAFDPVLAIEDAISPLHFIVDRHSSDAAALFVNDVRNATLSRDLNAYRGWRPAVEITGAGLADPNWGHTFVVSRTQSGGFHGFRVGAGAYLPLHTTTSFDPELSELFASESPVYRPNTRFEIGNASNAQVALAIAAGYRGRLPWRSSQGGGSDRDGLYIAADFDYLRGLGYQDFDLAVRLDTDASGLVTLRPASVPVEITRRSSDSGTGRAINLGVMAVVRRWELGFGLRGLANRLTWKDVDETTYTLSSLFTNAEFVESPTRAVPQIESEVPIDYRVNAAHHLDGWSVIADAGRGLNGGFLHAGVERRSRRVELRGGIRFSNDMWNPSGGIGLNVTERFGVDVAAFGTTANVEEMRQLGLAFSLRFAPGQP